MPHLVHLKNDGETTCFSQKRQKEKQLFWNVFWPITCLNLLKKRTDTTSNALCKISLCMNYGQAHFKVGQRGAASDHKHLDWQRHILWVMDQHYLAIYQAMKNFFSASLYLKRHSLHQCAAWPCELLQVGAVWPAALCMTANAKTLPSPMPTDLTGFLLRWQDIVLPSTAVSVKVSTWSIRGARLRAKRSGSPDTAPLLRFSRRTSPRSSFAPPTIPSPTSSCRNRRVILCDKNSKKKKKVAHAWPSLGRGHKLVSKKHSVKKKSSH